MKRFKARYFNNSDHKFHSELEITTDGYMSALVISNERKPPNCYCGEVLCLR